MRAGGEAISKYVEKPTSPAIFSHFFEASDLHHPVLLLLVLKTLFRSLKSKQHAIIVFKGVGAIDHTAHHRTTMVCVER
jgi:hypothetical protein